MKRDLIGRAVGRSAVRIKGIRRRVLEVMPLGPTRVELTPRELRDQVARMGAAARLRAMDQLGSDRMLEMLRNNNASHT